MSILNTKETNHFTYENFNLNKVKIKHKIHTLPGVSSEHYRKHLSKIEKIFNIEKAGTFSYSVKSIKDEYRKKKESVFHKKYPKTSDCYLKDSKTRYSIGKLYLKEELKYENLEDCVMLKSSLNEKILICTKDILTHKEHIELEEKRKNCIISLIQDGHNSLLENNFDKWLEKNKNNFKI